MVISGPALVRIAAAIIVAVCIVMLVPFLRRAAFGS
jgi:hypothetical protein